MEKITACRACKSTDLKLFFDLGEQPFANALLNSPDEPEKRYPLSLSFCENCSLVQLNHTADPKELFSNYFWVTGTSKTANEYARRFMSELVSRAGKEKGFVLEVASNDGVFLKPFIENGYKVLGVDPAKNIVDMAVKDGVPTLCEFFGDEVAQKIRKEYGPAQMVFARHVFPHVANTHDFLKGLHTTLADDGVLAIEVHYAKTILDELHYDSIYHEHLCYFTLKSLEKLLNDFGLYVFDLIIGPISGGALVVYAKKQNGPQSKAVTDLRESEVRGKTNELASWQEFAKRSLEHKKELVSELAKIKKELLNIFRSVNDKKGLVAGWGASARSSTMLNFCGIDSNTLPVIIDLNPLKQGHWTAGTHIRIDTPEAVLALKPDYILILAWNFSKEIMDMLKKKYNYKGMCVVPLPEFKVIDMSLPS